MISEHLPLSMGQINDKNTEEQIYHSKNLKQFKGPERSVTLTFSKKLVVNKHHESQQHKHRLRKTQNKNLYLKLAIINVQL